MTIKKTEILYIKNPDEPLSLSMARDVFSFGALMLTAWFLNTQMPPSGWINAVLAISWFLWILGKSKTHYAKLTPDEAREWLDIRYPREAKQ